jgi:hypothetical protein
VILLSNLAWGLAFTFRSGADVALLYDSLKAAGREHEFQRANERRAALASLAGLLGFLLGAPLAAASSYTTAITVTALMAAAAVPVAGSMTEPRIDAPASRDDYLRTLSTGARRAWSEPSLRWLFLFSGMMGAGAAASLLLFQQPWLLLRGVGVAEIGLWQGAVYLTSVLVALAAGWTIRRLGEPGAFALLPALLLACGAVLGTVDRLWAAVGLVGIAAARGLHGPVLALHVNRRIDSAHRATILSAQSLVGNLVMAAVWPIGGLVGDRFGLRAAFLAFAGGAAALGGGALSLWLRAERRGSGAGRDRVAA